MKTFFIGDSHGCLEHFNLVLDWIRSQGGGRIVFLGDLGDRGPDSKGCVQAVCEALQEFPGSGMVLGNHDLWLREFMHGDYRDIGLWMKNGGFETLESYNPDFNFRDRDSYDETRKMIPQQHIDLLENAPLWLRFGDVVAVHAGIVRGVELEKQDEYDMLWDRSAVSDDTEDGLFVIHGHTPMKQPYLGCNRIGLDTGCFATNRLTVLEIDEDSEFRLVWTKPDLSGMEPVLPRILKKADPDNPLRGLRFIG